MAYNFNDDVVTEIAPEPGAGSADEPVDATQTPAAAESPADAPASPGVARFNSCRWQQPKEEGNAAFCTHREVKPYAGTATFDAEAWCPECQHYKLRRAPKKRTPDDFRY